jgi:Sigma-70 factor, region 1.1
VIPPGSREPGLAEFLERDGRVREASLRNGSRALGPKNELLLVEGTSFRGSEELRDLIADAQERGYLTQEEIAPFLEEADLSDEQLKDLHTYLSD